MPDLKNKKLSRRDAIKLLGAAAGASVLANIPAKWSKPSLASGVLPVHAQTSCIALSQITIFGSNSWANFIIEGPLPSVAGANGYYGWYCQDTCLQLRLDNLFPDIPSRIQFTTLTQQFTLDFDQQMSIHNVLVNLGTGDYALDFVGTAGRCTWIDIKHSGKEGTRYH